MEDKKLVSAGKTSLPQPEGVLAAETDGQPSLLPCPFCRNTRLDIRDSGIGDSYVYCGVDDEELDTGCGARSGDYKCETDAHAAERWNRRSLDASKELPAEYLCIDPQGKLDELHLTLCARCQEAAKVGESVSKPLPEFALADLDLWFRRVLGNRQKYRSTTRSDSPTEEGHIYAEIPEWELRQKHDLVTQAINGVNALLTTRASDASLHDEMEREAMRLTIIELEKERDELRSDASGYVRGLEDAVTAAGNEANFWEAARAECPAVDKQNIERFMHYEYAIARVIRNLRALISQHSPQNQESVK